MIFMSAAFFDLILKANVIIYMVNNSYVLHNQYLTWKIDVILLCDAREHTHVWSGPPNKYQTMYIDIFDLVLKARN